MKDMLSQRKNKNDAKKEKWKGREKWMREKEWLEENITARKRDRERMIEWVKARENTKRLRWN